MNGLPAPLSRELRAQAELLVRGGKTATQAAQILQINPETVQKWKQRGKWDKAGQLRQAALSATLSAALVQPVRNIVQSLLKDESQAVRQGLSRTLVKQTTSLEGVEVGTLDGIEQAANTARTLASAADTVYGWSAESKPAGLVFLGLAERLEDPPIDVEIVEQSVNQPGGTPPVVGADPAVEASNG